MAYLVICKDSPNGSSLRKEWAKAHLDYIEGVLTDIYVAGPTSTREDNEFNSSCFIYKTDDLKEAEALFYSDPYYINGVYDSYEFSKFMPAAGDWIGGKIW